MRADRLAAAFAALARAAPSPDEPADVGPVDAPAAGQGGNHKTLNPNREPVPSSSTLNTQHSTLNTQHSTLNTQHSTLNRSAGERGGGVPRVGGGAAGGPTPTAEPNRKTSPISKPPQSQNPDSSPIAKGAAGEPGGGGADAGGGACGVRARDRRDPRAARGGARVLYSFPPWRQPRGKWMFVGVNSHTNASSKRRNLWEIDL